MARAQESIVIVVLVLSTVGKLNSGLSVAQLSIDKT